VKGYHAEAVVMACGKKGFIVNGFGIPAGEGLSCRGGGDGLREKRFYRERDRQPCW